MNLTISVLRLFKSGITQLHTILLKGMESDHFSDYTQIFNSIAIIVFCLQHKFSINKWLNLMERNISTIKITSQTSTPITPHHIKYILLTPSHYLSCICTKETKSEQCDFLTTFQVFEGNFHLFPGNNFPWNLLCYYIF